MGNAKSMTTHKEYDDVWWTNGSPEISVPAESSTDEILTQCSTTSIISGEREQKRKELEEDFKRFKQELARKHEKRKQLIADKRKEMEDLQESLTKEREENSRLKQMLLKIQERCEPVSVCNEIVSTKLVTSLREENEELRNEVTKLQLLLKEKDIIVDQNKELRISLAEMQRELQSVNSEVIGFEKERIDYQEHVIALKDIIKVTKEMLQVRENQITELKKKITTIEELLASKEVSILSDDLRQEYERQLQNIKDLRILYEDRQRADTREKENFKSQVEETRKFFEDEQKKNGELQQRINELETENSQRYDSIINLESNLGLSRAECRELQAEMAAINQLFSQILISFNNDQDIDLENLIKLLEENHDLLTNIVTNDEHNESSALPKVLLDLINQVNENKKDTTEQNSPERKVERLEMISEEEEAQLPSLHQLNSPEEIVENLPKVWRVLIELLSHQSAPNNEIAEKKQNENDSHCYNSIETPTGLRKVLSVSKTFIRLKSLILEKKSLEKEMTRLKHLNTHLEGRLQDQEKRLVLVSSELSKTWNVVGMMQKQHQQLHTQEKILRYELAQKRKLLTELKEELEYCRQKWLQAREQNSTTEEQWKQLRTEFASRKININDDINTSVESGYSDDKSSSDDDTPDSDIEKVEPSKNSQEAEESSSKHNILAVVQSEIEQIVSSFDTDATLTDLQNEDTEVQCPEDSSNNKLSQDKGEETQLLINYLDNVVNSTEVARNMIGQNSADIDVALNEPSTSNGFTSLSRNPVQAAEEFVARREERMKRLEEQCNQLYFSVAKTSLKGMVMSNRLNNLHETYGGTSENRDGETSENIENISAESNVEPSETEDHNIETRLDEHNSNVDET